MSKIAILMEALEDISHNRFSNKTTYILYDKNSHKLGHFEISDDGREIKEFDFRGSYLGKLARE